MHTPPPEDRDALLLRAGQLVAGDAALADGAWDGFALIVRYDDAGIHRRISGLRYRDTGEVDAATPEAPGLGTALDALREATRVDGQAPWSACVLQLRRATGRLHAVFEYDDPGRWDITPATLHDVAERARPVD